MRENYRFNFLIQIEVSAINALKLHNIFGLSVINNGHESDADSGALVSGSDHSIMKRSDVSLANIFFKVSHEEVG